MSWFALKTGPNFNNPVGERIAKWVVSRNWNFLMVCGQKRKFFFDDEEEGSERFD